ncbi:MAG: uncharacterized membrane protein YheB (UPF0754 family) [Flavobacteriales bacterium]|jgi:uncharacterized membrane protein YheB (UPF0754 family)|tara:strand:+ start:2207 stop:2800 length:594 start_codon:yes stop_codon:yes gene_type:complete
MIYLLPFIGAITGWVTNWVAVKMLFHPKEPKNFGLFKVQGVFPKRQKLMAEKLGHIVAAELFSIDDVVEKMKSADNTEVLGFVESKIDNFINVKLSGSMPMLAMFLNDDLKNKIKTTLMEEIAEVIPGVIDSYANKLKNEVDVEAIVYEKVLNFSSDKLEEILYSIMKKEFKFIELLGGVLGFLIGIIQLCIVVFGA